MVIRSHDVTQADSLGLSGLGFIQLSRLHAAFHRTWQRPLRDFALFPSIALVFCNPISSQFPFHVPCSFHLILHYGGIIPNIIPIEFRESPYIQPP